jgi:NADH:ubiquinone oxidoreductase subunit 3 (subunit A)
MAGMAAENQGWFAYLVLLVVAVIVTMLPLALQLMLRMFRGREASRPSSVQPVVEAASSISRFQPLNTRYFTAAQMAALLALPLLLLVPLVAAESGNSLHAALSLVVLCVTGGCTLVYANRKGDLRWIDSMDRPASDGDERAREVDA